MFKQAKLDSFESYFKNCSLRSQQTVYFCRLFLWSDAVRDFLARYMDEVKKNGVYIKGRIPNPDERQLSFFDEMAGLDFEMDMGFMKESLQKWLPRVGAEQREHLAEMMFVILKELQAEGKNAAMLRNAYIKFMCWFYYKFERILNFTGKENVPKILYEGEVSSYELKLFRILSGSGCDILLVEKNGDQAYLKQDPVSAFSQVIEVPGGTAFPAELSLSSLTIQPAGQAQTPAHGQAQTPARGQTQNSAQPSVARPGLHLSLSRSGSGQSGAATATAGAAGKSPARQSSGGTVPLQNQLQNQRSQTLVPNSRGEDFSNLYGHPSGVMGTNSWLSGELWEDALKREKDRGDKKDVYYNMFVRVTGTEDRNMYFSQLLRWKMKLEAKGRKLVLIEKQIPMPSVEEVEKVRRGNYSTVRAMLTDLLSNISYPSCRELESLVKKAVTEVLTERDESLQRRLNRAVCMVVWLKRYIPLLFPDWRLHEYPVFLFYGICRNENEAMFAKILSRLPVDVFIICPDLEMADRGDDRLSDDHLFDKRYENSAPMGKFPENLEEVAFHTAAYNAERDLDSIMYEDNGIYRDHQFKRAIPIILQTTCDEISILWKQEAKYRPNFEVLADRVMVPVIFSKISGVKEGNKTRYWQDAARFAEDAAVVIDHLPYITQETQNPVKPHVTSFLKNGKLQIDKIIHHPSYQYGFIREEMQRYMFDKIQQMLDTKIITGTFSRGVEYTILATALNLDKDLLRMIQKYDFTKEIPKLVLINTNESLCSLEDSILTMFLSLIGFDVLLLIPTGYQSVERFFTAPVFTEHQAGEYIYDMTVPDLKNLATANHVEGILGRLWGRKK